LIGKTLGKTHGKGENGASPEEILGPDRALLVDEARSVFARLAVRQAKKHPWQEHADVPAVVVLPEGVPHGPSW
jgi:hypothetical protein